MVFALSLIFIPVEIVSSLTLNLLGILLNKLDTTERNYVSSIILAEKSAMAHCLIRSLALRSIMIALFPNSKEMVAEIPFTLR